MRKSASIVMLLTVAMLFLAASAAPQDKPTTEEKRAALTPIKMQIVFTEFDGDKKVKSLPYSMAFAAGSDRDAEFAKLRIGSRVPLYTGKDGGLQYIDIGTNLDCRAERFPDGRYYLRFSLERSWVQGDVQIPTDRPGSTQGDGTPGIFKEPVIGQYKTDFYFVAREGQTIESTVATDPLNGKQLKIEFTLTPVK